MTKEEKEVYWKDHIENGFQAYTLPPYMKDGVILWVTRGIDPGSFLMAVLENDFVNAVFKADHNNLAKLKEWAHFVYWHLPAPCHGSIERVKVWKGLSDD